MKYTKLTLMVILFIYISTLGFSQDLDNSLLNDSEIIRIISDIDDKLNNEELNFHIYYNEIYNDSTFEIEMWQNEFIPTDKKYIKHLLIEDINVYMYDEKNKLKGKNRLEITRDVRFQKVHSPYWKILVKRRTGSLLYYKINYFNNYTNKIDESDTIGIY